MKRGQRMTDLQVAGMTCQHCVHAVTQALQGIAGVKNVSVDLAGRRARVEGEADPLTLVRAVQEEGYEAKVVVAR